ncbi:putative major facilitator superfamily protein [Lyophyllum shimeji]|uniref:Major facilitator superfamily protein n=1 Tax=Lyophyllum shimeji TaxID=47721 RepID=A0A9P3ULD7_LYOSH|nr:putative major facilitator superfamily protein [Lyophyllum shimeji]
MSSSCCDHTTTPSTTLHGHCSEIQSSSGHTPGSSRESCSPSEKRTHSKSANALPSSYPGQGTVESPYIIDWKQDDPENPYNWNKTKKWIITMQLALSTWTVSFGSSSYTGGIQGTMRDLHIAEDVAILGISLYVLGFALGPLVFAPMGELFGRRIVFLVTLSAYALFQIAGGLAHNLPTLLSCRLLTGIFGSSPLTNAGGAVSDIWNARERGLASAIYATVPFLGPVIGPIVGGFVAENPHLGWHFNFWLISLFAGFTLVLGYLVTPETYGPVLLRRRAEKLTAASNGIVRFVCKHDLHRSRSFLQVMRINLSRPFVFIVNEPIVLLLAIYISVMYGTLYALFSAFPIVFQQHRGFTPGQGGLAFLGVGCGIVMGTTSQSYQNKIYRRIMDANPTGRAPPEARLHTAIVGGLLIPVGLFWFAWTTSPSIHWIVPILAGIPFGAGVAQILQSLTTYLMDTYPLYFASSIAATIVLRSFCGAAFPLFSPAMFQALGDKWAMSVFAFMALACTPIPMLFWKYGRWIRSKSRVAYKDPAFTQPTLSMTISSQLATIP